MQSDAPTDDVSFFRKATALFLQHVLRKRIASSDNSDEEGKEQLNTFISKLVQTFFEPLADHLRASTVTTDTERANTKSIARDSRQNRFSEGIITYFKAQHSS
jgi:hypothetical protein